MMRNLPRFFGLVMSTLIMLAAFEASAEDSDPSTRIARLAYIEGSVSFQPGGTDQWVAPPLNRPLTTGDQLWSDQNSRAELELDGSAVRLAANTAVSLLNISDNVTQIQLSSGSLLLSVRRLDDGETYEVDTPNLAFSVLQPGLYRISVDATGNSTALLVRRGQGEVTGGGIVYPVGEREYAVFSGNDELSENRLNYTTDQDSFERWSEARDGRWENSESARYVSADVVGYQDLDEQGTWTDEPEYGHVWIPRAVEPGWAPYHSGHWAYVAPWGYTWIDDHAWGFAPFHYGRWVSLRGSWCWVPVPPRRRGFEYVRPVYAPALVAWVGVGAGVAWFALGPREIYVPSYRVSRGYVRNINVSNTNVNTTVINNVYNTTIINKRVVNNVTYVNRNVPGAVAATTSQAFRSAQPVGRHRVHVDQGAVANARVAPLAPAAMPSKRDLLGSGRTTDIRPPAAVQARPAVARVVPPASAPGFARRPAIINGNERRPFSDNQGRQRNAPMPAANAPAPSTQAAVPAARPAVNAAAPAINAPQPGARVAPPPRLTAPMRIPAPASPAGNPPAVVSAPNATRPQEAPQSRQPPSPAVGNPAIERRHVQDQQQQQAQAQQQAQQQRQQQAQQAQLEAQRQQQLRAQQQAQQQRQQQAQQAQLEAQRQQQLQAQQQAQQAQQAQQQAQLQAQRQQQLQAQQQAQEQAQARQQEQRRQQEAAAQKARRTDSTPPKPEKQP
jgi:DNA segregation ATPase FtsK/SpoIIIE-like protein